ncbi:MFS transporter [Actinokineospora globicatena]|uniref:MFS transporter n=1 Tax=Actinokineospora globicatena TaxID=103729 RepID=UPI0020A5E50C|nr:MFS transporter [Actinokineospora globicatena]MCP2303821.1 Sugar phosphate permease [Actinokineospora globicatena]GLW79026.1 MFS transporter [Actinokineospora globicatena]GLW86563.1 MFS transporter [Actinokineospora globicatena]
MPDTTTAGAERPRSRWGLPEVRGHTRFLTAGAIDSLGSGLLFAFQVVYFARTTSMSLLEVGLALTVAQLLAIPAPTLFGPLVDRFGPRAVAAAGNLVAGAGFAAYLVAEDFWHVAVLGLIVQVGVSAYWTSYGALVALASTEDNRTRWFGLMQALRNAGVGLGGAIAAAVVGIGGVNWMHWLLVANAVSYLFAAWLLVSWNPAGADPVVEKASEPAEDEDSEPEPEKAGGYRVVLRDRAFMRLVAVNFVFVLSAMVLSVLLAIYIIETLEGIVWLAGVLLTVNTVLVATTQTVISGWVEKHRSSRMIALAAVLNAGAFGLFAAAGLVPAWAMIPTLGLAILVYTLAEIIQSPAVSTLSIELAPPALRGRYLAVFQMLSWNVGGALAPALFTTLLSWGRIWPWVVLIALSLLSTLLVRAPRQPAATA